LGATFVSFTTFGLVFVYIDLGWYRTYCADTSYEFKQNSQGTANNHHKSSSKLAFEVLVDGRYSDVDG